MNLLIKSDWLNGSEDIQRYDFMAATIRLETMRVLLPGYGCHIWYLGECVYHWHIGPSRRHVPSLIPSSMLWSRGMTGPELGAALEGYDVSTLLKRSCHYQQYIQENLLEQVPTDPAEVNLSTSYPFCFLYVITVCHSQFEDVGSPIIDEVIEEQADTERIETKRTDEETEHASHTHHAMPA